MSSDGVARWFDDYLEVFAACGRGERPADALLDHYAVPLLLSSDDGFLALGREAEVVAMVEGQVAGMRTAGYHHSTVLDLDVTPLNATSTLCRGTFARLRADGSEIGRLVATYLLTETPGVRRISALAVHPAADEGDLTAAAAAGETISLRRGKEASRQASDVDHRG